MGAAESVQEVVPTTSQLVLAVVPGKDGSDLCMSSKSTTSALSEASGADSAGKPDLSATDDEEPSSPVMEFTRVFSRQYSVTQLDSFPEALRGVPLSTRLQTLKPFLGISHENDPVLINAVLLWRERAPKEALALLDEIPADHPQRLEAHHLAINIAQMHDMYDMIDSNVEAILAESSGDPHALFVKALYSAADDNVERYDRTAEKLRRVSPKTHAVLDRVKNDVVLAWGQRNFPPPTPEELPKMWSPKDLAIVLFGCPVNPDHTPTPSLLDRLRATLELASKFPRAIIIASGGAVGSEYTESEFIRDWLVSRGIDRARIALDVLARDTLGNAMFIADWLREKKSGTVLLVTSTYHVPRSRLNLEGALEARGVHASIVAVGAGNAGFDTEAELRGRLQLEQRASYRDTARARGYFDHLDF